MSLGPKPLVSGPSPGMISCRFVLVPAISEMITALCRPPCSYLWAKGINTDLPWRTSEFCWPYYREWVQTSPLHKNISFLTVCSQLRMSIKIGWSAHMVWAERGFHTLGVKGQYLAPATACCMPLCMRSSRGTVQGGSPQGQPASAHSASSFGWGVVAECFWPAYGDPLINQTLPYDTILYDATLYYVLYHTLLYYCAMLYHILLYHTIPSW
jgi:hypothetical protein